MVLTGWPLSGAKQRGFASADQEGSACPEGVIRSARGLPAQPVGATGEAGRGQHARIGKGRGQRLSQSARRWNRRR
jgi:hypothetical protein